jgi:hypothetical protein
MARVAALAGCALLVLFLAATLAADALPRRVAWLPIALLALLAFAGAMELARWDHGHPEVLLAIGSVAAPIVLIFGGAAWGTQRFYGWPDFGRHPPRAALVAAAVVTGVLAGARIWEQDLHESRIRAEDLRARVLAWRDAHQGAWPDALADAAPEAPRTRLGLLDPPPFSYGAEAGGARVLSFPVSRDREMVLSLEDGSWRQRDRPARGGA